MLVAMKKGVPGREQHEQRPGGSIQPPTTLAAGMRANRMIWQLAQVSERAKEEGSESGQ